MTVRERFLLDRLQLCDLYTRANGITYRDVCGDKAEIFVVELPGGELKLQVNVYPFFHTRAPLTQAGLEKCKDFVRRLAT